MRKPRKTTADVETSERLCKASPSKATEPVKSARSSSTPPVRASPTAETATARFASRRCASSSWRGMSAGGGGGVRPVVADVVSVILGFPEERRQVVVVDRVGHDVAASSRLDQAPVLQKAELVGYGRLRDPGHRGEVADTERSLPEGIEEASPGGVGERLEGLDQKRQQGLGRNRPSGPGQPVRVDGLQPGGHAAAIVP